MKELLFLVFIPITLIGRSQTADTLNRRDELGRKQGHWIYYGKDRPESGVLPEGKVEEGNYVDDRKEGIWIKYNTDGVTPKFKGEYENNRPKSPHYGSGSSREKGNFVKNQYHDSLKRFHENGKLEYEAWYNEVGKEHGTVNYYYPNGQLEFTYNSNNGTPMGKAYRYYQNGDLKEILEYREDGSVKNNEFFEQKNPLPDQSMKGDLLPPHPGKMPNTLGMKWNPNGNNKVYNADHEIWQDGQFKEGMLWNGKVYVYDNDGILLKVQLFQNGKYHSDGQL